MLSKGLILVLDMALASRNEGASKEKYDSLVQGLFREDVIRIPFTDKTFPSPS